MPSTSFQPCTDSASYFSEKCRQCQFACLQDVTGPSHSESADTGSPLSMIGAGAVIAGSAASFAGYPTAAAGLTIAGALVFFARLVR